MKILSMKYDHKFRTRYTLDKVKVGDFVKVNDWKDFLPVVGVSENYFVAGTDEEYSVFCKIPKPEGYRHGEVGEGDFVFGPDHWLTGWKGSDYNFNDKEWVAAYLASFESGESEISQRNQVAIHSFHYRLEPPADWSSPDADALPSVPPALKT